MLLKEDRELFKEILNSELLDRLPKHALKKLTTLSRKELKQRYPENHHHKKYGNLNRGFTDEELGRFFSFVTHPKAKLAFQLMHGLGLRVGEVVEIKLDHIDFLHRSIVIQTEKSGTKDMMLLHDGIYQPLVDWVNQHHAAILNHDGYLLYSEHNYYQRVHISKDWLRNYFRQCREEAGLNQVYDLTKEKNRKPHRLFRHSTHSFRRTFGTYIHRITQSPKMVQKALRQLDSRSCDPYIHIGQEELDAVLQTAFSLRGSHPFFLVPRTLPVEDKSRKEQKSLLTFRCSEEK